MEALLIGIPFGLYIYLRITLGNDISPQERDEALFREGIIDFEAGEDVKAFRYFEKVILKFPKSATAYLYRGKCHFSFENWEAAIIDFEKTLRIDNSIAESYYYKAICYYKLEEYELALFEFKRASRIYLDKNSEVLRMIGELEFRRGDFENAEKSLKIASNLGDEESQKLLKSLF